MHKLATIQVGSIDDFAIGSVIALYIHKFLKIQLFFPTWIWVYSSPRILVFFERKRAKFAFYLF